MLIAVIVHVDDTKDLQEAIEDLRKKEKRRGSSGPATAVNSKNNTPRKRAMKSRKSSHTTAGANSPPVKYLYSDISKSSVQN